MGTDLFAAWTGGKPKADWTGLEDPTPSTIGPNQYRGTSISSQAKSRAYRVQGLDTKFSKDSDLATFEKKIMKHLIQHGLDSITYVPDPVDATKMISVITTHARFNFKEVMKEGNTIMENHFDSYSIANVEDAKEFLMNSIDEDLEKQLYENCANEDSFVTIWMNLIHVIKTVSINRFDKIKDRIKSRKIKNYEGENVEKLASDFLADFKELKSAGMYDQNLTMTMLISIMEAGGVENEDFRHPLRTKKLALNEKLLEIRHLDHDAKQQALVKDELDVQSLLKYAKEQYRTLKDNNQWAAAMHARDSKAMNRNYGNVNMVSTGEIKKIVSSLIQSSGSRPKGSDTCYNCGEKGHFSRECPKKGRYNSKDKSKRNNPRRSGKPTRRSPAANVPPPKDGESEIKTIQDKKYYWCAKCNRWTLSHGTDNHKTKEELTKNRSAGMARVDFESHPSAFRAQVKSSVLKNLIQENEMFNNNISKPKDLCDQDSSKTEPSNYWLLLALLAIPIVMVRWMLTLISEDHVQIWLVPLLMLISGLLGFGTAQRCYESVEEPEPEIVKIPRARTGPIYKKKIRRELKSVLKDKDYVWSVRRKRLSKNQVTKDDLRASLNHPDRSRLHHEPRFNNLGRPNRKTLPNRHKISLVEHRIDVLKLKMSQCQDQLRDYNKQYMELSQNLRDLEHGFDVRVDLSRDGRGRPLVPSRRTRSLSARLKARMIHDEAEWPSRLKCVYMANLPKPSPIKLNANRSEPVLFDSGANCCITHLREDFTGKYKALDGTHTVDGIGKGLSIKGVGTVAWTFKADNGMNRTLKIPAFYVPSSKVRIASVQDLLKAYPKETVVMNEARLTLSGTKHEPSITIPYNPGTNLPVAHTVPQHPSKENLIPDHKLQVNRAQQGKSPKVEIKGQPSLTTPDNHNLSEPEKELLRWHYRLGHLSMKQIQWIFRTGILATSERARRRQTAAAQLTHGPLCTACQYAKQRRKTTPGTVKVPIPESLNTLKRDRLFPGQEISIDHFHCNPLGRLLHTYGKESNEDKYKGGCIFVDHSSGYTHVELQSHLNSHETLKAKKSFDLMCATYGVVPQTFLSDNGTSFRNSEFESHLKTFTQTIRHSGVGAHHANGIAERNIGTVLSIARAMLHHQALHWPDLADVTLWPLAVLHATYVVNRIPKIESGRSPLELFSRKTWSTSKFQDFHVWGCPVYVLDNALADGKKIPRWKPRAAQCVYVGHSIKHGHAIPLILNPETGSITPQYHVVFDDWFQTVGTTGNTDIDFNTPEWYETFGLTEYQYVADEFDDSHTPEDPDPRTTESEGAAQRERVRNARDALQPTPLSDIQETTSFSPQPATLVQQSDGSFITPKHDPDPLPLPRQDLAPPVQSNTTGWADVELADRSSVYREPTAPASPAPSVQRETATQESRSTKVSPKQREPDPAPRKSTRTVRPRILLDPDPTRKTYDKPSSYRLQTDHWDQFFVGKASKTKSDPDLYTWDEAMASPLRDEFLKAAQEEVQALTDKETWIEDLKVNATVPIVPATWVFKIKRTPDGAIKKIKARLCLRGDLMTISDQSNYSPVAAWTSVRMFLTFACILGWVTTSVDFSNAFVQSKLPESEPAWMHVPRGYRSTKGPNYCLRLLKSLYGHKRAPLLWFNHSSEAFKKLGLKQSEHDPCLWFGPDIMLVQYVDDCGIAAPNRERIDRFVQDLRDLGFELTQEESFEEFLGIKFETLPDGSIKCTQKGLIQKTLEAANMTHCNPNSVPATQVALGSDNDGEPMKEEWNYRGICGMLLYLSTNTRPDISYAVSQVCRFSSNPKQSHATAIKVILRYLSKTCDEGIIVKPTDSKFNLTMHVDADYCGLFGQEDPHNPDSVRSRTGYVICLSGWPIVWKSQLQTHLSQSTLEAEYTALSSALRVFLPLRKLGEEIIEKTKCRKFDDVQIHATVFEDNQSTFFLATNQRITSRTKYLLAKWHWFWDSYNKGEFTIVKCPTDEQNADYLTKGQPRAVFERNRKAVQGW